MPKYTVFFARFPGNFREHPTSSDWFYETYMKALADPLIGPGNCLRDRWSDTPIYMLRNRCVLAAKEVKADYLVMVDEDMEPDYLVGKDPLAKPFWESSWEFLMAHRDEPCAVAAPYGGGGEHENAFEFQWCKKGKGSVRFGLEQYTREQVATFGGIAETAALPTGVIVYDMRVFHDKLAPWFDYEHDPYKSQKHSTEDVYQTRNMSLAWYASEGRVGGKCYCNWDSWAGHWKERRVEKPELVPVEAAAKQLRDAVLNNHSNDERLIFLPFRRTAPPKSEEAVNREAGLAEAMHIAMNPDKALKRAIAESINGNLTPLDGPEGHKAFTNEV